MDKNNKFADKLKKDREYTTHSDISKKSSPGPKKKLESEKKTARLVLNLTQDEFVALESNAEEFGIKALDYARMILKKAGAFERK